MSIPACLGHAPCLPHYCWILQANVMVMDQHLRGVHWRCESSRGTIPSPSGASSLSPSFFSFFFFFLFLFFFFLFFSFQVMMERTRSPRHQERVPGGELADARRCSSKCRSEQVGLIVRQQRLASLAESA